MPRPVVMRGTSRDGAVRVRGHGSREVPRITAGRGIQESRARAPRHGATAGLARLISIAARSAPLRMGNPARSQARREAGWTRVLDRDLVLIANGGVLRVVCDRGVC